MIIDRRRGRLREEDLLAAYAVEKLHGNVAVGISIHHTGADPDAQAARDRRSQSRVGRASENREIIVRAPTSPPAQGLDS
jgi:hypothetical protein